MIYQGNAFDLFEKVEDNSIDALITDPPYGTTGCRWDTVVDLDKFWEETKRVLRTDNSPVVVFADQPFTSNLVMSNPKWFRHDWIWKKPQVSGALQARNKPFKFTEDIVVFSKKRANYYWEHVTTERDPVFRDNSTAVYRHATENFSNPTHIWKHTGFPKEILEYSAPRAQRDKPKHPTEKPVELMEYLITLYSKPGDTIFDPFMGSGSTGVAAQNLNREFVGFEMEEEYFEMAGERLNALPSKLF